MIVNVTENGIVIPSGYAIAKVSHNFSFSLLQSAAYFSRVCYRIEKECKGIEPKKIANDIYMEHKAAATGAVIMATTALESAINELYFDAVNKNLTPFAKLEPFVPEIMAEMWEDLEKKEDFFFKYNFVLTLARKPIIEKGSKPGQDAALLNTLRNSLIHYKPEYDTEAKAHKSLENKLRGKFEINSLLAHATLYFPHKPLGHGGAEWAVISAINFINEFFKRIDQPVRFDLKSPTYSTR